MEKKITDKRNLFTSGIIGLLLSFPVTGFIYGFSISKDCGEGISGIFGRILIGFVEAILNTITLGSPWDNEGVTTSTNLTFYVFLVALMFTLTLFLIWKRNQNK